MKFDVRFRMSRRNPILILMMALLSVMLFSSGYAGPIIYEPLNPAFGGSGFNGSYLLSNATSQRQYNAPVKERADAIENFRDTISRSLISRISRDIADAIYGEDALDSGEFVVGDTTISFERVDGQIVLEITDLVEGSTIIELPVPQF